MSCCLILWISLTISSVFFPPLFYPPPFCSQSILEAKHDFPISFWIWFSVSGNENDTGQCQQQHMMMVLRITFLLLFLFRPEYSSEREKYVLNRVFVFFLQSDVAGLCVCVLLYLHQRLCVFTSSWKAVDYYLFETDFKMHRVGFRGQSNAI